MEEKKKQRYDLGRLERWLTYCTPAQMGNELDEIMTDLVAYSGWDDSYEFLEKRFFILRQLRDIFWEMEKNKKA
jgi:sensor domain CHASE-containing protein